MAMTTKYSAAPSLPSSRLQTCYSRTHSPCYSDRPLTSPLCSSRLQSARPDSSCRLSRLHLALPPRPLSVHSGPSRRSLARLAVSAEQRQGESDDGGSRGQRGAGVRDDTRDGGAGNKGPTGGDDSSRRRKAEDAEGEKCGVGPRMAGAMESLLRFITPRQKGDIRDITLVSLSFAVLVYISQRLVCAYFALLAATQYW